MSLFVLVYPLIGLCSGFLAGLLGIGGGLVIVPALLWVLPHQGLAAAGVPHSAVATSLATVMVTSLVTAYAHHRRGAVEWPIVRRMAPGLAAGALAGALLATELSGGSLRGLFGVFALAVAVQIGLGLQVRRQGRLPVPPGLTAVGTGIGLVSAMVGVGGGTLTVPFLRWGRMVIQRAVGTSSACGFPIAVGGSLGFTVMAAAEHEAVAGGIYWPAALGIAAASLVAAPLGVRCAHGLPTLWLTRVFALALAGVGLRLLLGG